MTTRHLWFLTPAALLVTFLATPQLVRARAQEPAAAKLQNPVKPDATSLAAGKKLFTQHCVECHGDAGKGDGPRAEYSTPTPSNLTDSEWKHGASDGEIFEVIQKGVPDTDMMPFATEMPARQIWDVVNYIKSLGSPPPPVR
jgi:mono/diheme cytochrome c family protein